MRVKNKGLVNADVNFKGVVYKSDEHGVFDVPEEVGNVFVNMPGFFRPRETKELVAAVAEFKQIELAKKRIDRKFDVAKNVMLVEQAKADRGEGTPLDASDAVSEPATPEELPEDPEEEEEPQEDAEDEDEGEEDEGDEDEELPAKASAIRAKYNGADPNMKWKLDDLIEYARALGVAADTSWTKSAILSELEESA